MIDGDYNEFLDRLNYGDELGLNSKELFTSFKAGVNEQEIQWVDDEMG